MLDLFLYDFSTVNSRYPNWYACMKNDQYLSTCLSSILEDMEFSGNSEAIYPELEAWLFQLKQHWRMAQALFDRHQLIRRSEEPPFHR